MCFAARSIRDENYEREKKKDGVTEREKGGEREKAAWMQGGRSPLPEGLIENWPRILPVLDPLIVGPVGADQEARCLRNSQIVLHVYVDGFSDCPTRHLVHDQSRFRPQKLFFFPPRRSILVNSVALSKFDLQSRVNTNSLGAGTIGTWTARRGKQDVDYEIN